MPYVTVGDEKIFYAYHASPRPNAPDLLLVHGAGGTHQLWGYAIRSLEAANVYALDLSGHGRSDGTSRWSIASYAALIIECVDALQLEQVIVAGHSMGGATALQMALSHQKRVVGLVLVATGARLRVMPTILDGALSDFENTVKVICELPIHLMPHVSSCARASVRCWRLPHRRFTMTLPRATRLTSWGIWRRSAAQLWSSAGQRMR